MSAPKPGHFVGMALGMARGMRAAYASIAEQVDDIKAMDAVERKSAETTTYSMALALLVEEHRITPEIVAANLVSCLNDLRRAAGKPEIALHAMASPTNGPGWSIVYGGEAATVEDAQRAVEAIHGRVVAAPALIAIAHAAQGVGLGEIEELVDDLADARHAEGKEDERNKFIASAAAIQASRAAKTALLDAVRALAARATVAPVAPAPSREPCTGIAASWCHNCGDCTCEREESGEWGATDRRCPLHGDDSTHEQNADDAFDREAASPPASVPRVPGDLATLLREHLVADDAYRSAEAAGLSAQLLAPFARKAEDISFDLAEWTRANLEPTDAAR